MADADHQVPRPVGSRPGGSQNQHSIVLHYSIYWELALHDVPMHYEYIYICMYVCMYVMIILTVTSCECYFCIFYCTASQILRTKSRLLLHLYIYMCIYIYMRQSCCESCRPWPRKQLKKRKLPKKQELPKKQKLPKKQELPKKQKLPKKPRLRPRGVVSRSLCIFCYMY